jgi:ATP-dependent helicase/nuclease subunit B
MASPRVFNIPASAPFLPTLIEGLLSGRLVEGFPPAREPLALAQATLYLPTRRACRLAQEVFLNVLDGAATILPRIVAIGDVDEDEIAFAEAASGDRAQDALALPPAIGGLERRLLLTQLIAKWAAMPEITVDGGTPLVANTPGAALALADDLARLIDDMTTREVDWDKLDGLVPDDLDQYWQLTLKFLKLVRTAWRQVLDERGVIEQAERRDRLIAAEAARLASAHDGPVIAAGSTGSMPSTARLLTAIARLPHGAVVLPGLDTDLDEETWSRIADAEDSLSGHPQFALAALLKRIGLSRGAVRQLGKPANHGRERLLSEALRPADTTERWQERLASGDFAVHADRAMDAVSIIEAATVEEEALAVAVALREAVEEPGQTAALITPDRGLARRVLAALDRWAVACDDSGGDPLAGTAAGVFARLAAETALTGADPVTLLALLRHPLLRLGEDAGAPAQAVSLLELAILRGPRPKPGSAGLAHALAAFRETRDQLHRSDPRRALSDADIDTAARLVAGLGRALAPLESLARPDAAVADFTARHRDTITALATDKRGACTAFAGLDGAALDAVFEELIETGAARSIALAPPDYPDFFRGVIAARVVRRPGAPGSRVRIYGPLEARLQVSDRVVLAGLVEGVWPPDARSDPWLSRPMRHALGLDLPERRIGLSAHDFVQALGAREAILSRAAKMEGAPTVASRFLQRLAAVAGAQRWQAARDRGNRYLEWARSLDVPASAPQPSRRPAPRPPRTARPLALAVTDIESWLRDPYSVYARHILRLVPLDPVDTPPGAADRGSVIHNVLGEFTRRFADALPDDPVGELRRIGRKHFAPLDDYPEARAFWWPRFLRIAEWFANFEAERRAALAAVKAEIRGEIEIPLGERIFRLSARADRIERRKDGTYVIVDYKTGQPPSEKQVRVGLSPQLTLEAAILKGGGFREIGGAGTSVSELLYVALRGGEPAGVEKPLAFADSDADREAHVALARLKELASRFEEETQPYRSLVLSMWRDRYGDYDHLARVKEWSATGGTDGEAGAGE